MVRLMHAWYRLDSSIQKVERFILVSGIVVILSVGMAQIILDNIYLNVGVINYLKGVFSFVDLLSRQLTVWIGLVGASLATSTADHINIDAFGRLLKGKQIYINKIIIGFFCVIGSFLLTMHAFVLVADYMKNPSVVMLNSIPTQKWAWALVFPAAFSLITIRYLVQTLEYIHAVKFPEGEIAMIIKGREEEEEAKRRAFEVTPDEDDAQTAQEENAEESAETEDASDSQASETSEESGEQATDEAAETEKGEDA